MSEKKLLSYQKKGIKTFLEKRRQICALAAGTGKSLILYKSIEYLHKINKGKDTPFFICSFPHVLYQHFYNIPKEIEGVKTFFLKTKKNSIKKYPHTSDSIFLMTPDIMTSQMEDLLEIEFLMLAFDEAHMFCNTTTNRTKEGINLCDNNFDSYKLLMTATPCTEGFHQLYPLIKMVDTFTELGSIHKFNSLHRYKINVGSHYEYKYKGLKRVQQLANEFIFYEKVPMPKQITKNVMLPMSTKMWNHHESMLNEACILLEGIEDKEILYSSNMWVRINQLLAGIIVDPDLKKFENKDVVLESFDTKVKVIKSICSHHSKQQIIIWCSFRAEIDMITEALKDCISLKGGEGSKGNKKLQDFISGKYRIIVTHKACIGAGVSLENACVQIHASIDFSGTRQKQALARTNRINQTKQEYVYNLMYKESCELKYSGKLSKKLTRQDKFLIFKDFISKKKKKIN